VQGNDTSGGWKSDTTDPKTGKPRRNSVKGVYWRYGGASWGFYSQRSHGIVSVEGGDRQSALDAKAMDRLSRHVPAPVNPRVTVAQLAAEVFEVKRRELRSATIVADARGLALCLEEIGHLRVTELTVERLTLLRLDLDEGKVTGNKLAPASTDRYLAPLREVLNEGVRRRLIDSNPFTVLRRRSSSRSRSSHKHPADIATLERILAAAETRGSRKTSRYNYAPLIATLILTGARIGEVLALHWRHVDLLGGTVTIEGTLNRDGTVGQPKTEAGERSIGIPARLVDVLGLSKPPNAQDDHFVFSSKHDPTKPLSYHNVRARGFAKALEDAGLIESGITLHSLRHSAASLLIAEGLSAPEVGAHLGHANAAVTLSTYAHEFGERDKLYERVREGYGSLGASVVDS
jgi:integrase